MSPCNGECLTQCVCECYNEETDIYDEVCVCGHRGHDGYCPSVCCIPIECRNYKYCNKKLPEYITFCHNGMCMNCAIQMGKHIYTKDIEDCCICLENKIMLILCCEHKVCNDCWYNITKDGVGKCPLCRNLNGWNSSIYKR